MHWFLLRQLEPSLRSSSDTNGVCRSYWLEVRPLRELTSCKQPKRSCFGRCRNISEREARGFSNRTGTKFPMQRRAALGLPALEASSSGAHSRSGVVFMIGLQL